MYTERLEIFSGDYENKIKRVAQILKNGGIAAIPTETVYGLAATFDNDNAIHNVFKAKGRPQDNPLIVHISDIDMLDSVVREIPPEAIACAEKFWPGPFTMILKKGENVAQSVSAGLDTVAVRMPSDKTARDIIRAAGPLAAPSANSSGKPSPTTAQHVLHDLDGKIDAVVMGDECTVGLESTVITLVGDTPKLLRPGAVTFEQLREILPDIVIDKAVLSQMNAGETAASPGMKYKHYAPEAQVYLVEGNSEAFCDFVNKEQDRVAVCFVDEADKILSPKLCYGDSNEQSTLAHNVFEMLRKVDDIGASKVFIHAPSKEGIGLAVYNRLIRAAAFRVIKL